MVQEYEAFSAFARVALQEGGVSKLIQLEQVSGLPAEQQGASLTCADEQMENDSQQGKSRHYEMMRPQ